MLFAMLAILANFCGQADPAGAAKTRNVELRDGETVSLRVRVSGPNESVLTAVTLADLVENVVSAWKDRDLSVEVQGAKLFLKLLSKAEGHLDVLTTGGTHVRLYIQPSAAGEEYDGHVVLRATVPDKVSPDAPKKLPDALELVKAMRLGTIPPGTSVKRGGDATVTMAGDIEGRLVFVYETSSYRGYVLRLTNTSPTAAYRVDVTRFTAPRLVLAGAKSLVVAPQKSTLVYLVLWK